MKRRHWLLTTGAVMVLGTSAYAVKVGESLYIKAKNTKVMASAAPTAAAVTVLQPGDKITWGGSDAANKKWHKVTTAKGKQGLVFQANLSPTPPQTELVASAGGKELDPKAFASSGAATKALSEGALEYGAINMAEATKQLLVLEALAAKVKPAQLAEHAKKAELPNVPGVPGGR